MRELKRMTPQTRMVLEQLVERAPKPCYGALLVDLVDISPGSIYGVLDRLERFGWVNSWWENETEATAAGRPQRRLYELDPQAMGAARAAVEQSGSLWRLAFETP